MERRQIVVFIDFLLQRVFQSKPIPKAIVFEAWKDVIKDVNYHFPSTSEDTIFDKVKSNQNELAMFLYRIGSHLHKVKRDDLKLQIHFLMKDLCNCEIYFNSVIEVGFYIIHGQGTIIGSRNKIGKGFVIHQNCTIGHKKNGSGLGNSIGNNVKMYCNSSILGSLKIGDNVIIGAHTMVNKNIENNTTVISSSRLDYLQ
jgi:serine O-acetyltransferase